MFEVGNVAVYPGHGVAKIESIEEKEFSGMKQSCDALSTPLR